MHTACSPQFELPFIESLKSYANELTPGKGSNVFCWAAFGSTGERNGWGVGCLALLLNANYATAEAQKLCASRHQTTEIVGIELSSFWPGL